MDSGRRYESAMKSVGVSPSPGPSMHNAERINPMSERSIGNVMEKRSVSSAGNSTRTAS